MDKNTLRMNLLGGMNDYILEVIGDDYCTERWLSNGVPDGATEDDLKDIAENNEEFRWVCHLFGNLVKEYDEY